MSLAVSASADYIVELHFSHTGTDGLLTLPVRETIIRVFLSVCVSR